MAVASVNPVDRKVRSGAVRELLPVDLPASPGRDAVGVVDEIGAAVRGMSVGDRVSGLGGVTGATTELAVLSAWAHAPATSRAGCRCVAASRMGVGIAWGVW